MSNKELSVLTKMREHNVCKLIEVYNFLSLSINESSTSYCRLLQDQPRLADFCRHFSRRSVL